MNVHIHLESRGVNAGSDETAVADAYAAVGVEVQAGAGGIEIEMGNALRRKRIAEDGIEQVQIELAQHPGLPAGVGKVFESACDFNGMPLCRAGF